MLEGYGDFGPCLFQGGRTDSEGDPEAMEAVHELQAWQAKQFSRPANVDFLGEKIPDCGELTRGYVDVRRLRMRGTSREGAEKPVIESIQQNHLLLAQAFDNRKLTVPRPLYELAKLLGKLLLRNSSPGHASMVG